MQNQVTLIHECFVCRFAKKKSHSILLFEECNYKHINDNSLTFYCMLLSNVCKVKTSPAYDVTKRGHFTSRSLHVVTTIQFIW